MEQIIKWIIELSVRMFMINENNVIATESIENINISKIHYHQLVTV